MRRRVVFGSLLLLVTLVALVSPRFGRARATEQAPRFEAWTTLVTSKGHDRYQPRGLGAVGDKLYYVGSHGTFLEIAGRQLRPLPTGTKSDLSVVWGEARNAVYAAGMDGVAVLWDGAQLRPLGSKMCDVPYRNHPSLKAARSSLRPEHLWATSPSDVYVSGFPSSLLHFDGLAWRRAEIGAEQAIIPNSTVSGREVVTPQVGPIWGTGPRDVYTGKTELPQVDGSPFFGVGRPNRPRPEREPYTVMHFDGRAWAKTDLTLRMDPLAHPGHSPADPEIQNLPGNVTLGRFNGAIHRWDGRGWQKVVDLPTLSPERYWTHWTAPAPGEILILSYGGSVAEFRLYRNGAWRTVNGPQPDLGGMALHVAMTADGLVGVIPNAQAETLLVTRLR